MCKFQKQRSILVFWYPLSHFGFAMIEAAACWIFWVSHRPNVLSSSVLNVKELGSFTMEHMKIHVLGPSLESPPRKQRTTPGVTGGVTAFLLTGAGPLVIRRSCGLVAMTMLTVKPWIQRNLRFFFNDIHLEKRNIRIARLGCVFPSCSWGLKSCTM